MKNQESNNSNQSTLSNTPSRDEEQQLLALYNQGAFDEAIKNAIALVKQFPNYGFGWKTLGAALVCLGRLNEALAVNKKCIEVSPDDSDAHYNLGNTLKSLRHLGDAEICYRNTLVINPYSDKAYCNLGILYKEQGRLEEAKQSYRRALEINPSFDKVYNNLGILFKELGDLTRAEISYQKAIELNPNFAEAFYNLAYTQYVQGLLKESEQSYRSALAVKPDYVKAHHNLAQVLSSQKRYKEAEEFYAQALHYSPQSQDYLIAWIFVRRYLCDWRVEDNEKLSNCFNLTEANYSFADVVNPFTLLALENFTPQHLKMAGKLFADFSYDTAFKTAPLCTTITNKHQKLRIGYLSADFHSHATVYLMAGILENRNTEEFDVYLYSYGENYDDEGRSRVKNACEFFRNVRNQGDMAIAQQILADEIDILVDLKGYTSGQRLGISALRPAPIIVSWLGYPATLGHERLADYIIGDPTVTPLEYAQDYSEKLALMPYCYQPNDNKLLIGDSPTRQQAGLPEKAFVFCTFNQSYKITPEMFSVWCQLLNAVPNSVLWILEPHSAAHENLRREMQKRGVESSRLIFAPKMEKNAHLNRLQLADLALDTFPYTSHTTASDALCAGVPLVTKMGKTFASRVAASILRTMDLDALVTDNDAAYFSVALDLAQNPEKLSAIKQKITVQKNTSPLFNTPKFARNLERLYQAMWEQELKGERKAVVLADEFTTKTEMTSQTLAEILELNRLTEVVDIGANPIDGEPPYKSMLTAKLCRVTGFEPQESALEKLLIQKSELERYLHYAVADGKKHLLKVCRASGMTSLFEPAQATLDLFAILKPLGEVTQRIELQTHKLNDIAEIECLDFLKIDIQGAELSVFQHGTQKLAKAVAIQVEVSFVTLYENQPAMGEIDIELRRQGFIPHCFAAVKKWMIAPCVINNNPRQPLNQLLEADIVYVRDFSKPDLMTNEQLKHLAMIAHYCYGSFDLSLRCILLLEQRNVLPIGSQQNYLNLIKEKNDERNR